MKKIIFLLFIALNISQSQATEPYKNPVLPVDVRVADLVARLTLQEKVGLLMDSSRPVDRLGIKTYNWWNEALHGVARAGLATVFPQPVGLASTFDPVLIQNIYTAVSDEARAKNTIAVAQGSFKRYQGLTMWTPTVNIFRDPRWGRGIETYGEDPYLTSVMGVAVVKGLQGPDDSAYDKLHACAKHFAVHSGPEWNRHSFNAANISMRELYETYLPPFKALVQDAKVNEVMCAYNRFEGEPCCGNKQLLINILREEWGFKGIVVADCGAIADFYKPNAHATHPDAATASADAVRSGTDLDCGSSYKSLTEAVEKGIITEKELDISVGRLLNARFRLGEMDDPALVSWTGIPASVIASEAHGALALEAARKSITLLMNKNNILPLKKENLLVAVMGPNAHDSVMQWGNYHGTPPQTITILEGIRKTLKKDDQLIYEKGCDLVENTLMVSTFDNCRTDQGRGFSAQYWNNPDFQGDVAAREHLSTPFRLCTSGATVFAPGVNLTNFSARYNSIFTPDISGEIIFDFYACGNLKIKIDGKEVKSFRNNHGARKQSYKMNVIQGQNYPVEIDFAYSMGDAQLNFDIGFRQETDMQQSVDKVKNADIVIFAGGISPSLEGEEMGVNLPGFRGGDRTDIELPEVQRRLIEMLHQAGKKIIFINCSGSPIALEPETQNCEAIIQAWYPGQAGGKAVADALFGDYNPAGRLPVTFYRNMSQLPDFENYNMKGRTYRYLQDKPLFPFGYGLSYSNFKYGKISNTKKKIRTGESLRLSIPVKNLSGITGEEVVQLYLSKNGDTEGPQLSLRAFKRERIEPGKTVRVEFELTPAQLEWWNPGNNKLEQHAGTYLLRIGKNAEDENMKTLEFKILP